MTFDCKILLEQSKHYGFYVTGQTVSGVVMFKITKEKIFNQVVLQLKGTGRYRQKSRIKDPRTGERRKHYDYEMFEMEHFPLISSTEGIKYPPGEYSIPFSFVIPKNIPPSFAFFGNFYMVSQLNCRIKHKIYVEFYTFGKVINTTKTFKEEIFIASGVKPRVLPHPIMYGEQKQLIQLFNFAKKTISIKVIIEKSILLPGDTIKLAYEVSNESNLNIITVRARLMELYSFNVSLEKKSKTNIYRKTSDLVIRSPKIMRRSSYKDSLEFDLPKTGSSVDFARLVRRDYYVCFALVLPCVRWNLYLKVPVLVDATLDENITNKENDLFITNFIKVIKDYDKKF